MMRRKRKLATEREREREAVSCTDSSTQRRLDSLGHGVGLALFGCIYNDQRVRLEIGREARVGQTVWHSVVIPRDEQGGHARLYRAPASDGGSPTDTSSPTKHTKLQPPSISGVRQCKIGLR